MNYRISNAITKVNFVANINAQRSRLANLQEQLASGKRINRPSDDPSGAEAVINLKTSKSQIEQFKRNASAANQKLTAGDDTLSSYETIVERLRTTISRGLSDTNSQEAKNSLATEVEALRARVLNLANSKYDNEYLFGGSRQTSPPFDPTTATPNPVVTNPQYVQIEPGSNALAVGVIAENVFSDATSNIFTDLTNAVNALRGTGNPTADRTTLETTMQRLGVYTDLVNVAHTQIGTNMNITELAQERLNDDSFSLDTRIASIEDADFAETAVAISATQQALEATLQVTASSGRRNLFDFLA